MVRESQLQGHRRGPCCEQEDNRLRFRPARDAPEPQLPGGGAGGEAARRVEGGDREGTGRSHGATDTPPAEPARLREREEAGLRPDQDVRLRVSGPPPRHVLGRGLRDAEDTGATHGGMEVRQRRVGDGLHACERHVQGCVRG